VCCWYYKKNKRYLSTYCSGSEVVSALFLEEISKINKEKILLEVGKDPKYFSKISFEDFFKKFHILNINYNYWAINKTLFILDLFKKFAQILFPDPNLLKKKFYLIPMSQFIRGNDLDNFLKVGKFLVLITAISHSAIVGYSTNSSVDEALLDRFSQNIDVEYNKINSFNMIYNVFINFMINNNKLPFFLSESKNYSQVILHMLNLNNHLTTVENVLDYVKQISDIIEDENKNKKNGVWEKNIINRLKNGMLD